MKLQGLKVLDLSAFLPGPHMTMMMADHGADVIMVEPANGVGEPTREIGEKTADGVSVWFRNIARGKRSLKLNLKDDAGRELFHRLADQADVVVEAFRPGVVKRLGVDYETLSARNERLIYCSISAFGQDASIAKKPAHDLTVQGLAGLVDLNRGLEDGKPTLPNVPFADASASLMALSAIMMALYRRETTGRGDYIDLAMFDAAMAWTPNVLGPVFAQNRPPEPKEMRSFGGSAMYNLYETADGEYLILGGSEVKFAANLLEALGRRDLLPIAKLPPGPDQEPLRSFFRETFIAKDLASWKKFLSEVDCCWSWVRSLDEAINDPYTNERRMVFTDSEGHRHLGPPIRFREEPPTPVPSVPGYGEHSIEIAREAGLSEPEIDALIARGVI
ncbi:CaiB/BaiF CoA transferase family protein [Parvularcula lutaonensis]|uniref:CaiB/BaiF CoA transferase family protein n=1 Tax=Parvularcula lutaonensis TaxID=491923 RepID=A0ABV7MAR2_9PROT|nr:CaiB/BaiF CoA-transferase family protein [Parvularcula lutaonensis]GGY38635.1 CoA transferase [Parvularcula lutaonensis]